MSERFTDKYEPIEIELIDVNGKLRKYKTAHVNLETTDMISDILGSEKTEAKKVKTILALLFKKDEAEFSGYSLTVLTKVFRYISNELKKKSTEEPEITRSSEPESNSDSDSET